MTVEQADRGRPVRVLVVDDSPLVREILKRLLESDPTIQVVGMAADGQEAVELTAQLRPDLVTMDLVMPGMDGMEATERIMAYQPTPVLFLSSYFDQEGMYSRPDALAAGALDVVEKPALLPDRGWDELSGPLIAKVKALARVPVVTHLYGAHALARQRQERRSRGTSGRIADVVAIGVSSGGPRVLAEVLSALPPTYALSVVVVQHIAEGFLAGLIRWFQRRCALPVKVAEEGDALLPRRIIFAPEWAHVVVRPSGRLHLSEADPVNGHRPSVDVTFQSLAEVYGSRVAGVLLTGMGSDGAAGLLAIRRAGGITLVQDEASSAVFGMPRAAIELGAAERVLSPPDLVQALLALHRDRLRALAP